MVLHRGGRSAKAAPGRSGIVIALSGVDCAGKSTQREVLMQALATWGLSPTALWTRAGYTPALKAIKSAWQVLRGRRRSARAGVSARPSGYPRRAASLGHPVRRWLWLTSALLELLWVYAVRLRLLRASGRTVVCDRYLADCLFDFRVNFPDDRVEQRWLCRALQRFAVRPDAAFCLLVAPEETLERSRRKERFHWETLEVLEARWREYRALCRDLSLQVLDGERPPQELSLAVQRRVMAALLASELRPDGSH